MSSNEPVKNGCDVIYEMFHILNCQPCFRCFPAFFFFIWNSMFQFILASEFSMTGIGDLC